jgi:glutamate/tyrosine decarboxylase-like PLP-dependent enzyme
MASTLAKHSFANTLFPPEEMRLRVDDFLSNLLCEARRRVATGPTSPTVDVAEFHDALTRFDFHEPRDFEQTLAWITARMQDGIVQMTNPRYFGLFNPAPTFPAQCADRIATAFNPQLATSTSSPVPVALEQHVISAVAARLGFPTTAVGHFTTGGAEANLTALVCALTQASPDYSELGVRAFTGNPTFYVSREAHLAWLKIAHQCGIGRAAVRLVATDGSGRMDATALAAAIATDRAGGFRPVMIAATVGTTNAGMIDPLSACAALARENSMWLHADAAWGGAAVASPRLAGLLSGIELADSVTIDAHKWFATTMGCGMFITRHGPVLSSAFHVSTTYMPSNLPHLDPYVTSVQWSRRFLGLRLFLSLATAGWDGYAQHIHHSVDMAEHLRSELAVRGWTTVNASSLAVLCIMPPQGFPRPRDIVSEVLRSGSAWISTATFEGQEVIRACVTHGETTAEDVAALITALEAASLQHASPTTRAAVPTN